MFYQNSIGFRHCSNRHNLNTQTSIFWISRPASKVISLATSVPIFSTWWLQKLQPGKRLVPGLKLTIEVSFKQLLSNLLQFFMQTKNKVWRFLALPDQKTGELLLNWGPFLRRFLWKMDGRLCKWQWFTHLMPYHSQCLMIREFSSSMRHQHDHLSRQAWKASTRHSPDG